MNHVVHAEASSTASADAVFAILIDTERWPTWAPFDEAVLAKPGVSDREGVGAERSFRKGRTHSYEQVVAYEAPTHFAYVLVRGMPLRSYRADVRIAPTDTGCTITWHSEFQTSFPTIGTIYRMALQRFIADLAARLARTAERSPSQPIRS